MKKILLIFVILLIFSGCYPFLFFLHYELESTQDYKLLEENNFELDKYKIEPYIEGYNIKKVYLLTFQFDYGLIEHQIGYKIYGFKDYDDIEIKINKYSFKRNGIEIKSLEPINFYNYYPRKGAKKNKVWTNRFHSSEKIEENDILEISFDLTIKINNKVFDKIITSKKYELKLDKTNKEN